MRVGLRLLAVVLFAGVGVVQAEDKAVLTVGEFERIYDPSVGEDQPWYINDHCFVRGGDGTWHLFGITREEPARPLEEDNLAHAVAGSLTQRPWEKRPFALSVDESRGETHLWAPHVVEHEGVYYMFYCGGGEESSRYQINLATSKDLHTWERHAGNPLFTDGYDGRDPFVMRDGDRWRMYYTANLEREGGRHIVACRESKDLVKWGERNAVYIDRMSGTHGGPTESPFVVKRGESYYLFIGPRGAYRGPDGYIGTRVFRSGTPYWWSEEDLVADIESHAAEVVQDVDGKWYVSHCGWGQGGVYLAPLYWHDE